MTTQALKNWNKVKLGQVLTLNYGKGLPARDRVEGKYPVYGSAGIVGSHNTFIAEGPGIIVGRKGSIGEIYLSKKDYYPIDTAYYINSSDKYDIFFIYYLLKTLSLNTLNTDAAVPGLNRSVAYQQEFLLPDFPAQKQIADVLSTYDDLIENNTRRIQILEQMAQAIYTEWFVNFRFPGYKQIKMVDSGTDFGKIPEGWEVKNMTKFKCFNFFKPKVDRFDGVKRYFATADIGSLGFISEGEKVTFSSKPSRAQIQPVINSIWFARMKDTRKVCFFRNINADSSGNILLSSGMAGFRSEDNCFAFMFSTISSELFHIKKNLNATGATQISLTDEGLKQIKMVEPDISFVLSYTKIANPWLDEVLLLQNKNKILRKMRDLLLPKLVNGEIRV